MTLECGFNPRTHTGATTAWHPTGGSARFQSTHPYGCDVMGSQPWRYRHVSIHAPIRVRPVKPLACTLTHSFNPRTHTGATRREKCSCRGQSGFNPRTHTGATSPVIAALSLQMVSIHAPIRVRRLSLDLQGHSLSCFNPRTHTGATGVYMAELMPLEVSIHAPIRVRPAAATGGSCRIRFNPRTHTGATSCRIRTSSVSLCFNPRTHTGATTTLTSLQSSQSVSIHAPIRVRLVNLSVTSVTPSRFNPRTHTGATGEALSEQIVLVFQSTHPYGCDAIR